MKLQIAITLLLSITMIQCKDKAKQAPQQKLTHAQVMDKMFPKPKVNVKTVGIFLYDDFTTLDAMGPYQEMMGTKVFFIAKQKGIIKNMMGLKIQVDTSMSEVKNLDVLVIPRGFKSTYQLTKDTFVLNWIKAIDKTSKYTTSVCTGAWILGATGLLKDKNATTHWYSKDMLKEYGAKVQDKRWVQDGKYWTSAGVSAGIDMCLALVNDIRGEKYAKAAMLDMEYNPQPLYKGEGSEKTASKETIEMMRSMYNAGFEEAKKQGKDLSSVKVDNKRDFACGMPVTAGIADTAVYKGKTYGFCSKECKEEFKKKPASFLGAK